MRSWIQTLDWAWLSDQSAKSQSKVLTRQMAHLTFDSRALTRLKTVHLREACQTQAADKFFCPSSKRSRHSWKIKVNLKVWLMLFRNIMPRVRGLVQPKTHLWLFKRAHSTIVDSQMLDNRPNRTRLSQTHLKKLTLWEFDWVIDSITAIYSALVKLSLSERRRLLKRPITETPRCSLLIARAHLLRHVLNRPAQDLAWHHIKRCRWSKMWASRCFSEFWSRPSKSERTLILRCVLRILKWWQGSPAIVSTRPQRSCQESMRLQCQHMTAPQSLDKLRFQLTSRVSSKRLDIPTTRSREAKKDLKCRAETCDLSQITRKWWGLPAHLKDNTICRGSAISWTLRAPKSHNLLANSWTKWQSLPRIDARWSRSDQSKL